MSYLIGPDDKEVDKTLNKAEEAVKQGKSQWPGMTFEQGVSHAIRWMLALEDTNPMED